MLYLEDYLEMIEHLPQELRDRFTEIREMDLTVQNNVDALEKRVRSFFVHCRRGEYIGVSADHEFDRIKSDYYKVLDEADEKVTLAAQMYDLVDKYLRKLDNELYKFKCELEADHNGITELLEKRSLELDAPAPPPSTNPQKENRYRPRAEKRRDSNSSVRDGIAEKRLAVSHGGVAASAITTPATGSGSYNLQHIGAGNAIAAAASQAIAATQQMQQGRRTASLKASYEAAIHMGSGSNQGAHELLIGRDLAGAAVTALAAIERDGGGNQRRQKKKYSSSNSSQSSNLSTVVQATPVAPIVTSAVPATQVAPAEIEETIATDADSVLLETAPDGEWTYDPNEPKYCLCNQVSYGDMVACDNEDCPFEWFHYPCVGIQSPPKGKWYCPQCISSMRRRGSRKN